VVVLGEVVGIGRTERVVVGQVAAVFTLVDHGTVQTGSVRGCLVIGTCEFRPGVVVVGPDAIDGQVPDLAEVGERAVTRSTKAEDGIGGDAAVASGNGFFLGVGDADHQVAAVAVHADGEV